MNWKKYFDKQFEGELWLGDLKREPDNETRQELKDFIHNLIDSKVNQLKRMKFPETGRGTKYGDGYNVGIDDAIEELLK